MIPSYWLKILGVQAFVVAATFNYLQLAYWSNRQHRFGVRFTEIVTTGVLLNEIFWSLRKTIHITIRVRKNSQTNSLSWSVEDAVQTWMRIASVAAAFYCP